MPEHKDILVTKTHDDAPEHEHVAVAIKDAFDAAQRQIEDAVREMRGQVKPHQSEDHGAVSKFVAGDDYGFIETADGREVYFHRNSVLDNAFDRLTVGSEVRFSFWGHSRGDHPAGEPASAPGWSLGKSAKCAMST